MLIDSGKQAISIAPSLSAVIFACLPKCPLCLVLLLAPFGISLPHQSVLLVAIGWLLLAMPLTVLCWMNRRNGRTGALLVGVIAVLLMGAGRFWAGNILLVLAGAALMITAFLWATRSSASHPHCSFASDPLRQETPHGH